MASGNHAGPSGFNESGKPGTIPACATAADELRGPGLLLAGLCVTCGRASVARDMDGYPRHLAVA